MSKYTVISDIGNTLRKLLWDAMSIDPVIYPSIIASLDEITLNSPAEISSGDNKKLCLFLYHIYENIYLKNQEMINVDTNIRRSTPLFLNLSYLVIANTENKQKDHILLGKVMQIFYDNSIIKGSILQGDLAGSDEEYRITIDSMPFEQVIQLWHSFPEKSFQLGLCYQVTPATIDSTEVTSTARVREREFINGVF